MIPTNPDSLKKLKELAARNIANGDWGDEVSLPGEDVPLSLAQRKTKTTVMDILVKHGDLNVPKPEED